MGGIVFHKEQDNRQSKLDCANKERKSAPDYAKGDAFLATTHFLSNATKGVTSKLIPKRDSPYIITQKYGQSSFQVAHPIQLNIPLEHTMFRRRLYFDIQLT